MLNVNEKTNKRNGDGGIAFPQSGRRIQND
jgi:hypothetical protein